MTWIHILTRLCALGFVSLVFASGLEWAFGIGFWYGYLVTFFFLAMAYLWARLGF